LLKGDCFGKRTTPDWNIAKTEENLVILSNLGFIAIILVKPLDRKS
jgi:hypothetical protein